jgi:Cys-tRNA(Pro)/Cys-tRNA(Cys) deacylase
MTHNNSLGSPENDVFARIIALLDASNAAYTLHEHSPSVTIQDADANLWFPVERLVKTIAFRVKGDGYVLAALCGYQQVDYKKLAAVVGVNRTQIMRLTPAAIEADLGYVVGGVAPFALGEYVRVVLDVGVLVWPTIYCGTGRTHRTLEIAPQELVRVIQAEVAHLA